MSLAPKATGMVNIPRTVVDDFYRYKMPILKAKVEGRGNGVKTRIENMAEIAAALSRLPSYTIKFIGYELGSQTNMVSNKNCFVVNGRHDQEHLARLLDAFIERFLLCKCCGNPETWMEIRSQSIFLNCLACGELSTVDMAHRLSAYILKNPPPTVRPMQPRHQEKKGTAKESAAMDYDAGGGAGASESDLAHSSGRGAVTDDDFGKNWSCETTPEAVESRRREMIGQTAHDVLGTDPLIELSALFAQNPRPANEQLLRRVGEIAKAQSWKESTVVISVFGSLFDANIVQQLAERHPIMKLFVHSEADQKYLLYAFELLCQHVAAVIPHVSRILSAFYDAEILDEAVIFKWHRNPTRRINAATSAQVRERAQPFIEWIQDAEEDSGGDAA